MRLNGMTIMMGYARSIYGWFGAAGRAETEWRWTWRVVMWYYYFADIVPKSAIVYDEVYDIKEKAYLLYKVCWVSSAYAINVSYGVRQTLNHMMGSRETIIIMILMVMW